MTESVSREVGADTRAAPATRLRRATADDLGTVCELLRQNELPTDGITECIENFIVAEERDSICGAVGIERHGHYGLLRSAVVASECAVEALDISS